MSLLEQWREMAYAQEKAQGEYFWLSYFQKEQEVYEQLLAKPEEEVTGTVRELAKKYDMDLLTMVGFLDGINDSLQKQNSMETLTEETLVSLAFEPAGLYKNMVKAKADWLYQLPQWDAIFSPKEQETLYREQKQSGIYRREQRVGRNDPCICGSGKKYKKCCGR